MSYKDKVFTRYEIIDDESDWVWPREDDGAWDGPTKDWEQSHKEKYMKYLRQKNVVVTAGANCGLHTRFFSKLFHVVYAFEPAPLNFHCMVNNSQFNNVIKMQCALGKEHKPIRMEYIDKRNVGMHKVVDVPEENIIPIIPMITLDCLNIPGCDLIQLDVERYEYNVLVGAKNTIEKYKPVISVEVHTSGGGDEEVMQFLKDIDYVQVDKSNADAIFVPNNL